MCVLNHICICFSHLLQCAVLSKNCKFRANVKFDLRANVIKVKQICFTSIAHHVNPFSLEQMCGVTHIYRLFFACKCRANMRFDLCVNMTKVKQTWYFTTFAHHENPFSLKQMRCVTHIYRRGKVVLNVYFLVHICNGVWILRKRGIYHVCFACKCLANAILDLCANMANVEQTHSFTAYLLPM